MQSTYSKGESGLISLGSDNINKKANDYQNYKIIILQ